MRFLSLPITQRTHLVNQVLAAIEARFGKLKEADADVEGFSLGQTGKVLLEDDRVLDFWIGDCTMPLFTNAFLAQFSFRKGGHTYQEVVSLPKCKEESKKEEKETMKFSELSIEHRDQFLAQVIEHLRRLDKCTDFNHEWTTETSGWIEILRNHVAINIYSYTVEESPICHTLGRTQAQYSVRIKLKGASESSAFHKTFTLDLLFQKEEETMKKEEARSGIFPGLTLKEHEEFLDRIAKEARRIYGRCGRPTLIRSPKLSDTDDFLVGKIEIKPGPYVYYYKIPNTTNFHRDYMAPVGFIQHGQPMAYTKKRMIYFRNPEGAKEQRSLDKQIRLGNSYQAGPELLKQKIAESKEEPMKQTVTGRTKKEEFPPIQRLPKEEPMKPKFCEPTTVTVFKFQFPDGREVTSPIPEGYTPFTELRRPGLRPDWCFTHVIRWNRDNCQLVLGRCSLTAHEYINHPEIACWFADMGPVLAGEYARMITKQGYTKGKDQDAVE